MDIWGFANGSSVGLCQGSTMNTRQIFIKSEFYSILFILYILKNKKSNNIKIV